MRGRKPTPTQLKGNPGQSGKRRLNPAGEPKPARGQPHKPASAEQEGAGCLRDQIAPTLERMGVLTEADDMALQLLCEAYADYAKAPEELRVFGTKYYTTTTQTDATMHRVHPAVAVMQEADRRLRNWLIEFGKTPSARSQVQIAEAPKDSLASKYF